VGFSPELTMNVIPNRANYRAGEMVAAELRMQVRYPNQSGFEPYLTVNTGYSVIFRTDADSATGPLVTAGLGGRFRLSHRHALFVEADYQKGFQSLDGTDHAPSYVILSAGWQTGM
jgi:hypothetical protein